MIEYKIDILAALKEKGYNTSALRTNKLLSEATIQKLRKGELVTWVQIDKICTLLGCDVGDLVMHTEGEMSTANYTNLPRK